MFAVYKIEKKIFGHIPTKKEKPEGPIDDLPNFRASVPYFNNIVSTARNLNHLLYSKARKGYSSSKTVRQFISTGSSGLGVTVIKSESKYMCLWCNENRKEELKDKKTDSIFSKN